MNLFNYELLKKHRKRQGITQFEAAQRIGIARTTYADYEKGNIQPPIDKVQRISEWLDVPTSELMQADNDTGIDLSRVKTRNRMSDAEKVFMIKRIKAKVHIYETFDEIAQTIKDLDIKKIEKDLILDLLEYIHGNYALTSSEIEQYDRIKKAESND